MIKLTILGNGYTAQFLSKEALKKGFQVSIITRNISKPRKNIHYFNFYDSVNISEKLSKENIISTVPPNEEGLDPIIQKYGKSIASNKNKIIYENNKDIKGAKRKQLIDRLILNDERIENIRYSINQISKFCTPTTQTHHKNLSSVNGFRGKVEALWC